MMTRNAALQMIATCPEYIDDDWLLTDAGLELAKRYGLELDYDAAGNAFLAGHRPAWAEED